MTARWAVGVPRRGLPRRRPRAANPAELLDDASSAHRKLDPADELQDAQLDDGDRVHIVHGDVARGGHVLVNVRKFTGVPFASLDELVDRGMLTARVAAFLRACVRARLSSTPCPSQDKQVLDSTAEYTQVD
jgi:hypothetical protein